MEERIKSFLNFRKQFTKREWSELNLEIDIRLKEKADQLALDDSDLQVISDRLQEKNINKIAGTMDCYQKNTPDLKAY